MNQQKYFVPEIQGLRALAVLIVVLFHAELHLFSGGFVGVDVFFVISGFLITGLMLREYDASGGIALTSFFARRIKRLLPASFFVTIVTMLVFSAFYSAFETKMLTSSAIASLVYLSNVWFATISTDYLRGGADTDPFLHMWSLAVEEQFYLLWPLLLIAIYKWVKDDSRFAAVFLGVVIVSFTANILLIETSQPWTFFSAPTRAWEFGIGAFCSVLVWRQSISLNQLLSHLAMAVGVVLLAYAIFVFDEYTLFPGINAAYPVLGTALVLLAVTCGQQTFWSGALASAPARFIGDVSYSWYLWHWPAKVFASEFFPEHAELAIYTSVIVSFVLAVLTTRLVEDPVRRLSGVSHGRVFMLTLIVTAVTLAGFAAIRYSAGATAQSPAQTVFEESRLDLAQIYAEDCHIEYASTEPVQCTFAATEADKTVVLFGDSHAAHWFAAVEHYALQNNYRLVTFTKSACPSFTLEPFDTNLGRIYTECTQWRDKALAQINALAPELVVLSNYDIYWQSPLLADDVSQSIKTAYSETLRAIDAPVAVIKDVGSAPYEVPRCLARAHRGASENLADASRFAQSLRCDFAYTEDPEVVAAEVAALQAAERAYYIDLNDVICPDGVCRAMTGDRINYIDDHHISNAFSQALGEALEEQLSPLTEDGR